MILFLKRKNLFLLCRLSIWSAEAEFAGYSCNGITKVDVDGQGFFSPRHMGDGLVYELIVIRLCQISSLSLAVCLMPGRGRKLASLALYQQDVLLLRF